MTQEQILLLCIFGVVAFVGYGISRLVLAGGDSRMRGRLQGEASMPIDASGTLGEVFDRIARSAGKPFEPTSREEQSALRRRMGYAGFYSSGAMHLYAGARAVMLAAGLIGGYILGALVLPEMLMGIGIGGLAGFVLPTFWLDARIRSQRRALERALPDALDLMVVCVEAGLTIDAAMQRVGREVNLAHPGLARELAITHMETQMGMPRPDALRHMADRTGSPAIRSLTAMIIQAERFGTGVAQALRIHAESLRIKRQYAAEERAAKTTVKIALPLVVCIFPSMLIVVGGPAVLKIMQAGLMSGK